MVVKTSRRLTRYPLVRVVIGPSGQPVEPYELSLAERQDVVITEVIPPEQQMLLPLDGEAAAFLG